MRSFRRLYLAAGVAVLCFCSKPADAPPVDTAADVQAINQVREGELAAISTGQLDSLNRYYSEDVILMPPNEPAITGVGAVQTWARSMTAQMNVRGQYSSSEVQVVGDWAIDRYTATLALTPKAGGATLEEKIKGLHLMRRQADGGWRIAQDIWNTDGPPAPPQ